MDHSFGTRLSSPDLRDAPNASLRQIHSDKALIADQPGVVGEGDALISNQSGLVLAIRTADCLPVLLADVKNEVVAAVHAGWRGVVSEIVPKTVGSMTCRFGTRAEDLLVAIGPGIGVCCFEVGPEVAVQFVRFFPEQQDLSEKAKVDLAETVIRQLTDIGVTRQQIDNADLCTCCRPEIFHSYRRDRDAAGRMVSTIGIKTKRREEFRA